MTTNINKHQKYNAITNSTFLEKLPDDDDDPVGSKHVANIHNTDLFIKNLLCSRLYNTTIHNMMQTKIN